MFEVGSTSVEFIDEVFHTDDISLFGKSGFDDSVISERDSLFVDLAMSSFVHERRDGLFGRVTIGDIRFNSSEHVDGGFV